MTSEDPMPLDDEKDEAGIICTLCRSIFNFSFFLMGKWEIQPFLILEDTYGEEYVEDCCCIKFFAWIF